MPNPAEIDALIQPLAQQAIADLCTAATVPGQRSTTQIIRTAIDTATEQYGREAGWRLEELLFDIGMGRIAIQLVPARLANR
jgi:hypothetical protein